MNIIIAGYGAMGKIVHEICLSRGHNITAIVDPEYIKTNKPAPGSTILPQITQVFADNADCVIEFSWPGSAVANSDKYCNFKINAVMGTTGWYSDIETVKRSVEKSGTGFIYGPNFSIGAHLMFKITAAASRLVKNLPEYDIMGYELHHNNKKDSPSGTALNIADIIINNCGRKKSIVTDKLDRKIKPDELHFASVRGGSIPGTHRVILDSEADSIEISHTARSRKGFALGAVIAAEWINKKSGFFEVRDFMDELLTE